MSRLIHGLDSCVAGTGRPYVVYSHYDAEHCHQKRDNIGPGEIMKVSAEIRPEGPAQAEAYGLYGQDAAQGIAREEAAGGACAHREHGAVSKPVKDDEPVKDPQRGVIKNTQEKEYPCQGCKTPEGVCPFPSYSIGEKTAEDSTRGPDEADQAEGRGGQHLTCI